MQADYKTVSDHTLVAALYVYRHVRLWIMSFFAAQEQKYHTLPMSLLSLETRAKCQQSCAPSCLFTKAQMTAAPQLLPLLVSNLTSNASSTPLAFFLFLLKPN